MEKHKDSGLGALEIVKTAKEAVATALLHHKAIGNEIVFWKDGRIVREKFHGISLDNESAESIKSQ